MWFILCYVFPLSVWILAAKPLTWERFLCRFCSVFIVFPETLLLYLSLRQISLQVKPVSFNNKNASFSEPRGTGNAVVITFIPSADPYGFSWFEVLDLISQQKCGAVALMALASFMNCSKQIANSHSGSKLIVAVETLTAFQLKARFIYSAF